MGSYYGQGNQFGPHDNVGPLGCAQMIGDGAHIYDAIGDACWSIKGRPITIGDTMDSIMAGMEMINFNFRRDGTQPALTTVASLPGPLGDSNYA